MDFFGRQANARVRSRWLLAAFALATGAVALAVGLVLAVLVITFCYFFPRDDFGARWCWSANVLSVLALHVLPRRDLELSVEVIKLKVVVGLVLYALPDL